MKKVIMNDQYVSSHSEVNVFENELYSLLL